MFLTKAQTLIIDAKRLDRLCVAPLPQVYRDKVEYAVVSLAMHGQAKADRHVDESRRKRGDVGMKEDLSKHVARRV